MEGIWQVWMDTKAFALDLAAAMTVGFDSSDAMNNAVE